jgi:hypothetical protein
MEPFGGDELPEIGEGHGFNDEEQILHVRVHTQQPQILPEDEDFMRDFDRLMTESFQVSILYIAFYFILLFSNLIL